MVKKAGIRELKNHLSNYLEKVKFGDSIIITERSKPIARITPIGSPTSSKMLELVEHHIVSWDGMKPKGSKDIVQLKGKKSISQYIAEERER